MRRKRLATLWWPGLSEIWVSGRPWGLLVACAAAGLLSLALLGSFAWTEPFSPSWRIGLWSAVVAGWAGWALFASLATPLSAADPGPQPPEQDTFEEAQEHYLKGHYLQAELVLVDLLRRNRRDVEARLMLATLLRRTQRIDEAVVQLAELGRCEDAEPWQREINRERELIAARTEPSPSEEHESEEEIEIPESDDPDHQPEKPETDDHRGEVRPAA
jgi:hypothetical protein